MPRKTTSVQVPLAALYCASMRPRPDATENARCRSGPTTRSDGFNEAAARCHGKPAIRSAPTAARTSSFNEAAARCHGKPRCGRKHTRGTNASMRPRPDATENVERAARFVYAVGRASMRPRPDATENWSASPSCPLISFCFNEAAARCHGKPRPAPASSACCGGFNEAAARCHGKLDGRVHAHVGHPGFNEAAARCHGKQPRRTRPATTSSSLQ